MILVTGATGFLGSRLLRKLAQRNDRPIRCLVRPGTPKHVLDHLLADLPPRDIEIFPASFNDETAVRNAVTGVQTVYHTASSKQGSFAALVANNVATAEYLYQAALDQGVSRFVLVSSLGVSGVADLPRGAVVDEGVPMDEHPDRRDPYSFSKHLQESLVWKYAERGLPVVVIRPGVIFGLGRDILTVRIGLHVFGVFLHLGGRNPIPLTYVDNCADAVVLAGMVPGIDGEVIIVVDDNLPTSQSLLQRYRCEVRSLRVIRIPYRVLRLLARMNVWYTNRTDGQLPAIFTPYKVDSAWKAQKFTNAKAKTLLGWRPKVSMRDALDLTFSSLKLREVADAPGVPRLALN